MEEKGTGTIKKLFVDDVDSLELLLAHSVPEGIANLLIPLVDVYKRQGKYGRMRQRYLKEHRPGLYSSLILSEKRYPHLLLSLIHIEMCIRDRLRAAVDEAETITSKDVWPFPSYADMLFSVR